MSTRPTSQMVKVFRALRQKRPRTPQELQQYLAVFTHFKVPGVRICHDHAAPLEYLWSVFNGGGDCVVWANRGGGKTLMGAAATLLDCHFNPACQVRILGGSLEQSARMYEYLLQMLRSGYEDLLSGPPRKSRCSFANGSGVELLTQSAKNVRGRHVHRLRCDEVELFDREVYEAAKFCTNSSGGIDASMELISTMHRPFGLMHEAIAGAANSGSKVFKWCLWEVIEQCRDRSCSQCALAGDCGGRAKAAQGYMRIDDAIAHMRRSSRRAWESEMLCMRPSLENAVFPDFDESVHVARIDYDESLPVYRSLDFGFVNPFVCLWIQVAEDGGIRIVDEYVRSRASIAAHAEEIKARTPQGESRVAATYCDPSGACANDVTGTSSVKELRELGIQVRYRRSRILEGVEQIRRSLRDGSGRSRLVISSRCPRLIEALRCYHYTDASHGAMSEAPYKDGVYDHPIDALRYFMVNHQFSGRTVSRAY